jgi:hypothetical protein
MKAKDLTGLKIGILTVIENTGKTKYKKPSAVWKCECECGVRKEYSSAELLGSVRSCGCLRAKNMKEFGASRLGKAPAGTLELGESTKRCILATYKNSARKRKLEFLLSEETFMSLIFQDCHYCGSPPNRIRHDFRRSGGDITYNGIDRMNNKIGYTTDNCVPCCFICNRAKDSMTTEEFAAWINLVHQRQEGWGKQASTTSVPKF